MKSFLFCRASSTTRIFIIQCFWVHQRSTFSCCALLFHQLKVALTPEGFLHSSVGLSGGNHQDFALYSGQGGYSAQPRAAVQLSPCQSSEWCGSSRENGCELPLEKNQARSVIPEQNRIQLLTAACSSLPWPSMRNRPKIDQHKANLGHRCVSSEVQGHNIKSMLNCSMMQVSNIQKCWIL